MERDGHVALPQHLVVKLPFRHRARIDQLPTQAPDLQAAEQVGGLLKARLLGKPAPAVALSLHAMDESMHSCEPLSEVEVHREDDRLRGAGAEQRADAFLGRIVKPLSYRITSR
jgi:hypothetical protein